jgi:chemotaxis signal transduction protein
MSKAAAWIMKINETSYISVSRMELVHIISEPVLIPVPRAPSYCRTITIWNDNILPVADIALLLNEEDYSYYNHMVAVTSYRDSQQNVQYGGILLAESPELEHVNNDQFCHLSGATVNLHAISLSCFTNKKGFPVPVIDMSRLFSSEYTAILEQQT